MARNVRGTRQSIQPPPSTPRVQATRNYEGGLAFTQDPKLHLYLTAAASLLGEGKFYQTGDAHNRQLVEAARRVGAEDWPYLLKLARHLRRDLHLRTAPIVLLAEATAFVPHGQIRPWVPQIVRRADEPGELLAYWIATRGKTFDRGLLKGLADALGRFNEYELAKYDHRSARVRLRDVLRIVRPRPAAPEQSDLWRRAVRGQLATPHTWEVVISTRGAGKAAWEEVLPDMGMMARLRNLRNFLDHDVDVAVVAEHLEDAEAVRRSQLLPWRWWAAARAIQGHPSAQTPRLLQALERACTEAVSSVPALPGRTLVAVDVSGSMAAALSARSKVTLMEAAALLGAVAARLSPTTAVMTFSDWAIWVPDAGQGSLWEATKRILASQPHRSTMGYRVLEAALAYRMAFDRIIVLSDMEMYNEARWSWGWDHPEKSFAGLWNQVLQAHPETRLYLCDFAGYGHSVVESPGPNAVSLAGWSERLLEYVGLVEGGPDLVGRLEAT